MITRELAEEIRREHTPIPNPKCSCKGWVCSRDSDPWPCGAEQWAREILPPVTISAYPGYAEATV